MKLEIKSSIGRNDLIGLISLIVFGIEMNRRDAQVARDRKNILGDEYTWDLFRMFQLCL